MTSQTSRARRTLQGFSLLELVLSMVLALALLSLASEGYLHVIESSAIDVSAQVINDALTDARQDAIIQNSTIEVRFYEISTSPLSYGSLQLRWKKDDGSTPPAARLIKLPNGAVIDATPTHSSLVTVNGQKPLPDATDLKIDDHTRSFHFFPDGSTDLAATGTWLLTIRPVTKSDPANFPKNWACIRLNPITGRTQIYRP